MVALELVSAVRALALELWLWRVVDALLLLWVELERLGLELELRWGERAGAGRDELRDDDEELRGGELRLDEEERRTGVDIVLQDNRSANR